MNGYSFSALLFICRGLQVRAFVSLMYVFKSSPGNVRYHFVFCFMASQQLLEIEPQVTFLYPSSYNSMLAEFLNIDRPYFCILNLTICHKFSTELWADDWCLPMHNVNNTSGKCFTRFCVVEKRIIQL